jgi:hypothetical protein
MVDQDSPHQLRRDAKELRAVLPADALLIDELEIGFVHETRGLQRVPWPLVKEVAGGDVAQLPIDNGKQILERVAVAVAPGDE